MRQFILLIPVVFLVSPVKAQVNTESMRLGDIEAGFTQSIDLELSVEKADKEVLDLGTGYRCDFVEKDNYHTFLVVSYEHGYEKEKRNKAKPNKSKRK